MARARSDGLGITKVGLGFAVLLVVVAIAAANTGNNGLYLVMATMAGVLVLSHFAGAANVRGLEVRVVAPVEAWAGQPAALGMRVRSRRRWAGHRMLRVEVDPLDLEPAVEAATRPARCVLPRLGPRDRAEDQVGLWLPRRGRYRFRRARVRSLYPFGMFRKGRALPVEGEVLVYPALHPRGTRLPVQPGRAGEHPTRRAGWGHELLGLREFRLGDDPKDIHWKQTARTGDLVLKERETERSRRLQIVLDNGVEGGVGETRRERFELLVSEAATAAVDHLEQGHEVALVTRDAEIHFAAGVPQKRRILEELATVELKGAASGALAAPDSSAPHLRLVVAEEVAA